MRWSSAGHQVVWGEVFPARAPVILKFTKKVILIRMAWSTTGPNSWDQVAMSRNLLAASRCLTFLYYSVQNKVPLIGNLTIVFLLPVVGCESHCFLL